MLDFDPSRGWHALADRLAENRSERHRQLLRVVIDHIKAEVVTRDIDAIMGTLVPEPAFHVWVNGRDIGPKGNGAVRRYYDAFLNGGGAMFESVKERVVVDDNTLSHEGPVRNLVSGVIARRRGYTVPDETGHYLVRFRNVVWWSFDDAGLAYGEDSYTTFHPDDWERVHDDDLPPAYLDYLAAIATS